MVFSEHFRASTSLNPKDRTHIEAMRGCRILTTASRVDIAQPSEEPMMWLPNIVAGAVGAARQRDGRYLQLLRPTVTELTAEVR